VHFQTIPGAVKFHQEPGSERRLQPDEHQGNREVHRTTNGCKAEKGRDGGETTVKGWVWEGVEESSYQTRHATTDED
jgi:hypothetical protein